MITAIISTMARPPTPATHRLPVNDQSRRTSGCTPSINAITTAPYTARASPIKYREAIWFRRDAGATRAADTRSACR